MADVFMSQDNYYLRVSTAGFALATGDSDGTLFRKELAYPGTFAKVNDAGEMEFELPVDEGLIDHWVDTFEKMRANGVDVPVPIGHDTSPEKRRGTIERLAKEPSEAPGREGQPALFCYVRFKTPEVAAELKDSNVSLFMPPTWTDGMKRRYIRPIRHVAITDYPVIPGLSPFQEVAAGFELSQSGDSSMPMSTAELAKRMGITLEAGEDPAECILKAWEQGGEHGAGMDEVEEEGSPSEDDDQYRPEHLPGEEDTEDEEVMHRGMGGGEGYGSGYHPDMFDDEESGSPFSSRRRGDMNYDPPPSLGFSHSPMLVKQLAKSRTQELDMLLRGPEPRITKPVYDRLVRRYCTQQQVAFALSMEAQQQKPDDFEDVVAALSMLPVIRVGEQTSYQEVGAMFSADSTGRTGQSGESSPIAQAAAKRAEAIRNSRNGFGRNGR
jgi:hypothetical protein